MVGLYTMFTVYCDGSPLPGGIFNCFQNYNHLHHLPCHALNTHLLSYVTQYTLYQKLFNTTKEIIFVVVITVVTATHYWERGQSCVVINKYFWPFLLTTKTSRISPKWWMKIKKQTFHWKLLKYWIIGSEYGDLFNNFHRIFETLVGGVESVWMLL